MVNDWLAVVQNPHFTVDERIKVLLKGLKFESEQTNTIKMLAKIASGESSEQNVGAAVVWERAATVSMALEQVGAKREARSVAKVPMIRGLPVDLEDKNCVEALLVLARCRDISTVKDEIIQIALGRGTHAQCVSAAAALAHDGNKEVLSVLQELSLQDIEDREFWRTKVRAEAIEALLHASAYDLAADAAFALAKRYDDKRSPNIFQELWGRAVLLKPG
jgi:hypothetical protein